MLSSRYQSHWPITNIARLRVKSASAVEGQIRNIRSSWSRYGKAAFVVHRSGRQPDGMQLLGRSAAASFCSIETFLAKDIGGGLLLIIVCLSIFKATKGQECMLVTAPTFLSHGVSQRS